MLKRYNSLSDFLKNKFGCKVYKVSLNAGFTCPNRDGTKGAGGCIYCEPETLIPSSFNETIINLRHTKEDAGSPPSTLSNPPSSPFFKGGKEGDFIKGRMEAFEGLSGKRPMSHRLTTGHENSHPPLNPLPSREGKQIIPSPFEGEGQSLAPKYLSGGERGFSEQNLSIKEQLNKGLEYIRKRHKAEKFISYFQINTNTYASVSELERIYRQGIDHPDVVGMAVSTRPDCVDDVVLDLLKELSKEKFLWLELGLQSSHNKTLKLINRCHTVEDFTDAVKRVKERNIPVCGHVILGLPGEKKEDILNTARFLADIGIWGIKLHHIHIHKGTKLEEMYNRGEFRPLGLDRYAELVVDFLQEIPNDVIIHRICGDTSRRFLIAPDWSVNKFVILERIHRILEERNAYQGTKIEKTNYADNRRNKTGR